MVYKVKCLCGHGFLCGFVYKGILVQIFLKIWVSNLWNYLAKKDAKYIYTSGYLLCYVPVYAVLYAQQAVGWKD